MQAKNQISLTRKTLYGIMFLAVFLAAFGAESLISVRAQGMATETPVATFTPVPENRDVPVALTTTTHCGTISSNQTWASAGNVHVINCNLTVASGVTLTIEAGAIVKFESNTSAIVQGSVRVLGTSADPVYLTSIRDDTVGGDTNNDGAASSPGAGNWSRIEFQDSSNDATSLIDYAVIRYGGGCCWYGGIDLLSASPTIQNTTLASNQGYAIRVDLTSFPTLTNNTYTNNGINALALRGGTINSDTTWNMTDTAYFLIDTVAVGVGNTLTVDPGVVVKFENGRSLVVQGALRVLGTVGNPVYFTSSKDDTVKGDTNNDGAASSPGAGNWSRIEFQDSSNDATSLIDYAVIRYGGGCCWYGGIDLLSASPTIQNSTIVLNHYGIYTSNSTPTLGCNNIYSNNSHGLYNATTGVVVNAKNQWWGHSSGPFHPTLNPTGIGNAVSDGVDFSPFRISPCSTFSDVSTTYWAYSFIERLYNAGITGGCSLSPLMYCPETNVNRAQMAIFLLRGEHGSAYVPPAVGTGTGFTDVPADYWAAAWIKQLAIEGITSGCGPSLYCPETSVTRDQMAVFLLRAKHGVSYTPPPATGVFTDVPTTHWAAPWIEQLAAEGITGGCGVDTYCPSTPVTRAQMAVFLVRTFNLP